MNLSLVLTILNEFYYILDKFWWKKSPSRPMKMLNINVDKYFWALTSFNLVLVILDMSYDILNKSLWDKTQSRKF